MRRVRGEHPPQHRDAEAHLRVVGRPRDAVRPGDPVEGAGAGVGGLPGVNLLEVARQVGPGQPGREQPGRWRAGIPRVRSGRPCGRPPWDTRPGTPGNRVMARAWLPAFWLARAIARRSEARRVSPLASDRAWAQQRIRASRDRPGSSARPETGADRRNRGTPRRGDPCDRRRAGVRPPRAPGLRPRRNGSRRARRPPAPSGPWRPTDPSAQPLSVADRSSRAASSLPESLKATPRMTGI